MAVSATLGLSIAVARFVSSHPYLAIILSTCLFLSVSLSEPLQHVGRCGTVWGLGPGVHV